MIRWVGMKRPKAIGTSVHFIAEVKNEDNQLKLLLEWSFNPNLPNTLVRFPIFIDVLFRCRLISGANQRLENFTQKVLTRWDLFNVRSFPSWNIPLMCIMSSLICNINLTQQFSNVTFSSFAYYVSSRSAQRVTDFFLVFLTWLNNSNKILLFVPQELLLWKGLTIIHAAKHLQIMWYSMMISYGVYCI